MPNQPHLPGRTVPMLWATLLFLAGTVFNSPGVWGQENPQELQAIRPLQELPFDDVAARLRTAGSEEEKSSTLPVAPDPAAPGNSAPANGPEREVSLRGLPRNLLQDQKDIWLFPVGLAKGRHLLPTLAVTGLTAGLIVADPHDVGYFRRTTQFNTFNNAFSSNITAAEIGLVPAAFFLLGHFKHNSYAEHTALLAGEACADGAVVQLLMKIATRRVRPSEIAPQGPFNDTFFNSQTSTTGIGTGFPSGHATAAFAVATVFAHRYRQHRWVPWMAYGVASLIAFSRVSTQAHFPSDVFVGAAIGFSISQFVVLRPR